MSFEGKVHVGDLVVMNELPDATKFEVVDMMMHGGVPLVKLREYRTNYASKWHDQSIIHAVVKQEIFDSKHLVSLIKKELKDACDGDLMEICQMFGHRFEMLRSNQFEQVASE